ncbi:hypothetical protein AYK24_06315 [Thermoplasmatales archaeon SG8-52-4]|nr:MAG: hypothetical protein AYK24_06315 [Thermoplasmatales archaeon SG8-52-4]
MQKKILSKGLVIGIIFLFIGIGIQPALSYKVSLSISDDITPPETTHTLDPPAPDGENGWYVSDVLVKLNATDDISGVKEIKYKVDNGATQTIIGDNGTFVIDIDKDNLPIEFWAIDNAENEETHHTFYIDMDQTRPDIDLTYNWNVKVSSYFNFNLIKSNVVRPWTIILNATAADQTSGMDRVEFYLNMVLQDTVYGPGPYYTWSFLYSGGITISLMARAYDNAGNMKYDEIVDPCWINTKQSTHLLLLQFLDHLQILHRLVNIWRLNQL